MCYSIQKLYCYFWEDILYQGRCCMIFKLVDKFRINSFFVEVCKWSCFFLVCLILLGWFTFGYQQEWFSKFQEWDSWVFFECEKSCIIILWERKNADILGVDWVVTWSWSFMIFSRDGNDNSLLYGDKLSYDGNSYIILPNYKKTLYNISKKASLFIQVNWNIKWNLKIDIISSSFSQRISSIRKDFWTMEPFYQYGINMKYWVSIRWTVIIKYLYGIFVLSLIWILIFVKWKRIKKFRIIFYVWIWLFLFMWIRNAITHTYSLNQWLSWYRSNKEFFDMGDFIPFIEKVRDKLDLSFDENKDCEIFMKSNWNRNINDHGRFYLKPCKQVVTWDLADYKIYYKVSIPREDSNKKVLLEFNGSYLLDNNSR